MTVIEGTVGAGRRLGRELGFPTANLPVPEGLEAEDGVYAAWAEAGGVARRLEIHLIGFRGDLYGATLRVELVRRIRGERKFASLDALRRRIEADRDEILRILG